MESRLGREVFARVGIVALTAGLAFTLSRPYAGLPAGAPATAGFVLAMALAALGIRWKRSGSAAGRTFEASSIALTVFAALRLTHLSAFAAGGAEGAGGLQGGAAAAVLPSLPSHSSTLTAVNAPSSALDPGTATARGVLALAALAILGYSLWRRSPSLFSLSLLASCLLALGAPVDGTAVVAIALVAIAGAAGARRLNSALPLYATLPAAYGAYVLWMLGNPIFTGAIHLATAPSWAPLALLVTLAAVGMGLRSHTEAPEGVQAAANAATLLNAATGGGLYLLHVLVLSPAHFAMYALAGAVALLALAGAHAGRVNSTGAFVYAMAGHLAASAAIVRLAPLPDVFVWLALQSTAVVATAIWLRSRFVVVANFGIFLTILAAYAALNPRERGISVGFGLVAIGTARLLAWKKGRLDLKTERMRNAYLAAAFVVFPYALAHLVPRAFVALAWLAAALAYYALSALLHNRKYRWMAHGTLLLTALYLTVVGIVRLEPAYRNISFLAVGAVLLAVSLLFNRARNSNKSSEAARR